ncbi:CinA family protein [Sphingomonas sp. 36D10-4-7]|jgi:nicotinamide-nucleotide amidase|uniref:CinA family protein n=1 Tax=Sphingomonas corticis TaxID=2722791 RepID=A0ABX1CMV7_9SPHN|nr:CinA family protein [Sphingomonas corticis]
MVSGGTLGGGARVTEPLGAVPDDVLKLAQRVLAQACDKDLSIATAESCTGGLLASLLTDVEGASHAFERGYVVYSKQAKCELLGIAPEVVERCNAVTREVAEAMASGALAGSHADIALGITGFAGPGAPDDEPGLVHLACATRAGHRAHRECHFGDVGRGEVRSGALRVALEMMGDGLRVSDPPTP